MGLVWRDGSILMIQSARGEWECPGGQVEMGEDPIAGLRREIYEETGCQVVDETLASVNVNRGATPYPIIMLDYITRYRSGALQASEESIQVEWMTPSEAVAAVTHPSMSERLAHLLSFNGRIRTFGYRLDPFEVLSDTQETPR